MEVVQSMSSCKMRFRSSADRSAKISTQCTGSAKLRGNGPKDLRKLEFFSLIEG